MMHTNSNLLRPLAIAIFALSITLATIARAEKADQDKPIVLEAEKVLVNDVQQVYELEGSVLLTKGSILITGDKGNIKVDPEGYEYVDVQGNPKSTASFRQRREGLANEFMQGRGQTVTYNAKIELLTLTGDANLKRLHNMQMLDQLRGWKIDYDDVTQQYKVSPPINAKAEDLPLARAILSPRRKATLEK
jgi:lipopolysaccharide export system protein LptA